MTAPPLLLLRQRCLQLSAARCPLHRSSAALLLLRRRFSNARVVRAQALETSDHRGHWHAVALDAASKSRCAAERVQWLVRDESGAHRVLVLTADASEHSRLLRHVDEHMAFNELERRGHGVYGVMQWCHQALEETGLDKRVFPRGRMAAFLLHHVNELPLDRLQRSMTSSLGARRAVLDLLAHFQLLEAEGISPAPYIANASASEDPLQIELAHAYARYRELLEQHRVTSWDGVVLDVLERSSASERPHGASSFLDALLRGFTDVVVDDLQAMTPAMVKLIGGVCAHATIGSSVSFSRVLQSGDACPRGALLQRVLRDIRGVDVTTVELEHAVAGASSGAIRESAQRLLSSPSKRATEEARSPAIECLTFDTVTAEELGISELIKARLAKQPTQRIAVLAPTYADVQRFVGAFQRQGIAVHGYGEAVASGASSHLFDEPGVNAVFSLLVALCFPSDSRHLYNVLRSSFVDLSPQFLSQLMEREIKSHVDLLSVLDEFVATRGASLGPHAPSALASELEVATKFVDLIKRLRSECHDKSAQAIVQTFLEETGRLESLLDPASPADELEAVALADFLRELEAAQSIVQSPHVPFVVPYLQQLRESHVAASFHARTDAAPAGAAPNDGVVVLPLTRRSVQSLDASALFLVSMRDSKFPGRMKRVTTPLPYKLLSEPFPVQTRSEFIAQSEQLAFEALTCATDAVVLSFATVASGPGGSTKAKRETVSRVLLPLWHDAPALASPAPAPPNDVAPTESSSLAGVLASAALEPMAYEPAHLSYSQITEYLRCPQRYFLARVMKLGAEPSSAMLYGRALHEAIASFATSVQASNDRTPAAADGARTLSLNAARARAHRAFEMAWASDDSSFVSLEQARALKEQGHRELDRFCDSHADRDVLHVEHAFDVAVPEYNVTLRGIWDRVDRTPRGPLIYEFKSNMSGSARAVAKLASASLQLKLYLFAFERVFGVAPRGAVLEMIGGDATEAPSERDPDGFVAFSSDATTEALEAIDAVATGLRAGDFAPRPSYMECAFCPYAASACRVGADAARA